MPSEATPVLLPTDTAMASAAPVEGLLRPQENVLGGFQVDLDPQLRFGQGEALITNQRLLARFPGETGWTAWELVPGLVLAHHDHAGVGTLALRDGQRQLAVWRFTLGRNPAALRFLAQFEQALAAHAGTAPAAGADLTGTSEPTDAVETEEVAPDKPPSTWTLLRLGALQNPTSGGCWPASC